MTLAMRRQGAGQRPATRWTPLSELEELHQRMEQLFEGTLPVEAADGGRIWVPFVDIEETEDSWLVEAELPGARPEDVNVEVHENELVVTGEIKERERHGILRRRTRRIGRFEYRVTLPGQTNPENIGADLHDGVLTIRIPKAEQARSRRIEVRSDGAAADGGAASTAGATAGGATGGGAS
jgi:HSP20 family protein